MCPKGAAVELPEEAESHSLKLWLPLVSDSGTKTLCEANVVNVCLQIVCIESLNQHLR